MLPSRTPLEDALWASGRLNATRQSALDAACGRDGGRAAGFAVVSARTETYDVVVRDSQSGAIRQQIALPPAPGRFRARPATEGDAVVLITGAFQKAGELPVDDEPAIGLYRHQPLRVGGPANAPYLGWSQVAPSSLNAAAGSNFGPLDLVVRPPGHDALVIDRGLGVVHHLDLAKGEVRYSLPVRPPGGTAHVQVAWVGSRLVVVDPATGALSRYDLHDQCALYAPTDLGHLLNVVASPDGHSLYLLGVTPRFGVLAFDADTFKKAWDVPLKGEPFNRNDGTQTIMAMAPDGRHLAVLSAIHSPEPQTPLLTGLSTDDGSTLRLARLPAGRRPLALAFATENPRHAEHTRVAEAVVALGYASRDEVGRLLESLAADGPAATAPEAAGEPAPEAVVPPDLATLVGDGPWRRIDTQPARPVTLPALVDNLIADFLVKRFLEQTGRDCRQDANACQRILSAAGAARKTLETAAGTPIALPELMPRADLHAFVGREQVLEWLAIIAQAETAMVEALGALAETDGLTVPDNCPACGAAARGRLRCQACGKEVLAAEALARINAAMQPKKRLLPTTTDPQLFLPPGHLLIADPPRQRVMQLNQHGRIVWHLAADHSHPVLETLLKWPIDALRLPNEHTLVIDRVGRRVFEVTPEGRPYWEWPASAGALREPVRVARNEWGESFIVDRLAHRIWRADANGEPMPGYGKGVAGIGPGELCSPTDLQVLPDGRSLITDSGNHRVIELVNGDVVWQYGNAGNVAQGGAGSGPGQLQAPRRAIRVERDRTLILDAGNHRILLVDRAGGVLWHYDTMSGDRATALERPIGLARLGPDRLACWDARCLIELDLTGTILWAGLFQALEANPRLAISDGDTAGRQLWRIERLADDDPERQQAVAELQQRRSAVAAMRQAWKDGSLQAMIRSLKDLAKKRVAAAKPWRIDLEKVEGLADDLRHRLRDRLSPFANRPAVATPATPAPPPPTPANTEGEGLSVVRGPIPVVIAQPFASQVVHLDLDQSVRWAWGAEVLNEPEAAILLPNGRALIADTYNHRVLEVDMADGTIHWETTAEQGIRYPKGVARLANGNTLIADAGNHRALELAPDLSVAWEWRHVGRLRMPTACERTPTGTTLITDQGSHVVTEVAPDGEVVWTYGFPGTPSRSDGFLHHPIHAVRRPSGNTLITNGQCNQVIEVDPGGTVVWRYDGLGENRLINPTYVLEQGKALWIVHDEGRQVFEVSRAGKILWRAAPSRRR